MHVECALGAAWMYATTACYVRAVVDDEQDQIVFVMVGDRRLHRSLPAGHGERELEELIKRENAWIAADDEHWIVRENVLYAYLVRAGEDRGRVVSF